MDLRTGRLLLRPLTVADLDQFVALHADPEVARYVRAFDRDQALERLRAAEAEWAERGHGLMAVLDRRTGEFLGRAGLRYWPQFGETEAGWVLRRAAWGHGYATEAARACVTWGFATLDVGYLTAMIHPDNARSAAVARRLGFARLRDDRLGDLPVVVHALERGGTRA